MSQKKILLLGGAGYKGAVLTEYLLTKGFKVRVIDNFWFGNRLENHDNLEIVNKDIRDLKSDSFKDVEQVIHLANIANDPTASLDPLLSWEVNVLASIKICNLCKNNDIKQLIFASSGSVYGVKKELEVTEDLELIPISIYNKTKMVAERIFLSFKEDFKVHCIRPATVCGYSKRMRLDVAVNMLTYQALSLGKMTVFGGEQIRPNINIHDIKNLYEFFLKNNETIDSGCYNAGFENLSIIEIAELINMKIPSKIEVTKSDDIRSYRLSSKKLLSLGFKNKHTVEMAVNEIIQAFENKLIINEDVNSNINWMKKNKFN